MRSKLFVPGSRADLFAKALAGDADTISFDVEDSVPEGAKARAREQVAGVIRSAAVRESAKAIIVRINALGSPQFEADVTAFATPGVALLNLPKVQCAEDVQQAAAALERAECLNGVEQPIQLLINIETPRALRLAAIIAGSHPRVAGLQLGLGDLFEPQGMDRRDLASVHAAMFAVRMACGEYGRFAYDSAFPDLDDAEGFRREAELARSLGYAGKSCVHPQQVSLANEIFRVGELTLAAARRIVAASKAAARLGHGAFVVDGRMIDLPSLRRAEALLADPQDGALRPR